ncbi:MAG: metallophosphoesterase [Roseivirga sp.]
MTWKINRRVFLKSSAAAVALAALPSCIKQGGKIRFGLLSDSHYADRDEAGIRFYRESAAKMEACVEVMNQEKVDFMIHLGDFKDQDPEPDEQRTLQYLKDFEAIYAKFNGPRYHVLGNHDMDSLSKAQFQSIVENTGIDRSETYYSFDKGDYHFVVLDACFNPDGSPYDHDNFKWYDANVPQEQLDWLEKDLKGTEKPTLVFVHQMLEDIENGMHHIKNFAAVRAILESSGKVTAVFQGHKHEERHKQINDIHYYTIHGMVDYSGPENNSFALVTLDEEAITIDGYFRVSDLLITSQS